MANESGITPTKGNLIAIQRSLELSTLGFELLDRKRNILIREMMLLVDKAKKLRGEISETYAQAYEALQKANMTLGVVEDIANTIPVDRGVSITYRSVMGVEIPHVQLEEQPLRMNYGMVQTNSLRKTQRRANALENILIPRYRETAKFITAALEEKEREEFSRMKVIKATKMANS